MNPQETLKRMSFGGKKIEGRIYRTVKSNRGKVVCESMKKQRWFWTWNSLHTRNILVMIKGQEDIKQGRLMNGQEKEFQVTQK